MKHLLKIGLTCIIGATTLPVIAQNQSVEMADVMRSNGKIYVVVAICLTILIGLFLYVWKVDRKISKLERYS